MVLLLGEKAADSLRLTDAKNDHHLKRWEHCATVNRGFNEQAAVRPKLGIDKDQLLLRRDSAQTLESAVALFIADRP